MTGDKPRFYVSRTYNLLRGSAVTVNLERFFYARNSHLMAKRFTDTDKWKKPFIRSLSSMYKVLWLYILDECDHAGIWQVDIEIAQIKTGGKFDANSAKKSFGDKIHIFHDGEKWFIPDFIEFQYGKLNSENRLHNSVINILQKYDLIDEENKPLYKDLNSTLEGAKYKDKDKEMVKDKEKDKVQKPRAKVEPTGIWQLCVKTWFDFYEKEKQEKPSFSARDSGSLKKLIELITKKVVEKNFSWTEKTCESHFLRFLQLAYGDPWLSKNFMLHNLHSQFDKILANGKDGKINGKEPTGADVNVASAFAKIDMLYNQNGNPGA